MLNVGQEASQQGCADAIRSTSIRHMRLPIFIPALLLLPACGTTGVSSRVDREPPSEFGRPGWVHGTAGFGGWVGGVLGGIVSIVALPITYPITLVCEDGIGDASRNEVLLWPVSAFATAGHFALGFTEPCAQIWYFNTLHTRERCLAPCVAALDEPYHLPDGSLNECILCDEVQSGPVFKAVAGRTRRNSGVASALCRPCREVRPIVHRY